MSAAPDLVGKIAQLERIISRLASDPDRCPGCGNIVRNEGRSYCWKTNVDVTQIGYRYLEFAWGYCYTLRRDIDTREGAIWLSPADS